MAKPKTLPLELALLRSSALEKSSSRDLASLLWDTGVRLRLPSLVLGAGLVKELLTDGEGDRDLNRVKEGVLLGNLGLP